MNQPLRDPFRHTMNELADIHFKYGFDNDALLMMRRAFDECRAVEDQFAVSKKIVMMAFEMGNDN